MNSALNQQQIMQSAMVIAITMIAVMILIAIAVKIRSWYRDGADDAADAQELLLQFHDLRRQGGLSEDEYRSIRGRLTSHQPTDSSAVGTETKNQARTLDEDSRSDISKPGDSGTTSQNSSAMSGRHELGCIGTPQIDNAEGN